MAYEFIFSRVLGDGNMVFTPKENRDGSFDVTPSLSVDGLSPKKDCKYRHYSWHSQKLPLFCGCEWIYGTYFGWFLGFMVDFEAVAMGQVLPLG